MISGTKISELDIPVVATKKIILIQTYIRLRFLNKIFCLEQMIIKENGSKNCEIITLKKEL